MIWLCGKLSGPPESDGRKQLVLCACECAELALPYTTNPRVKHCIDACKKWGRGEATISELKESRAAAYTAAAAAPYSADAAAPYAAAAYADYAAAAYAAYAADATYATYAVYAAHAAAYAARDKVLLPCADIVRKHYTQCPLACRH